MDGDAEIRYFLQAMCYLLVFLLLLLNREPRNVRVAFFAGLKHSSAISFAMC